MPDFILVTGDIAMFMPVFGPATVVVRPGILQGSGPVNVNGRKVCVLGDEKNVMVPGCAYMTPIYSIPGMCTLKITSLGPDQIAKTTMAGGKPVLLKGSVFMAEFDVISPAMQPPKGPTPPIPDTMLKYPGGTGNFINTNMLVKGT